MLYCVVNGTEIIGCFKNKDEAVSHMIDCWFDGIEKVKVCPMTEKEYQKYMKKMLDKHSRL